MVDVFVSNRRQQRVDNSPKVVSDNCDELGNGGQIETTRVGGPEHLGQSRVEVWLPCIAGGPRARRQGQGAEYGGIPERGIGCRIWGSPVVYLHMNVRQSDADARCL